MSFAPQSVSKERRRSRKLPISTQRTQGKAIAQAQVLGVPSRKGGRRVESLGNSHRQPMWLRSLLVMQRHSNLVTFLLVAATLSLYAWTVYTQQQWGHEYHKLENLQRQERQMTATNEVLKNQLAQQAENPDTGLVAPTPANTIFLPPAPQRPSQAAPEALAAPVPAPKTPLGY